MRFVTNRKSTYVGSCIYCGTTQGELTEEHVSPYALNGCIVLRDASCRDCCKATTKIERHVLRHMWGAARAEMRYRTRNKKSGRELYPLNVIKDGVKSTRNVLFKDALKIIELPIFKPPAALSGEVAPDRIECISKDQFVLVEKREDLAARIGVDEVYPPDFDPDIFARFIAKCSLGYAVERYGIDAFESFYVQSAILGKTNGIGRWVGSPDFRELPIRKTPMSGGFRILLDNNVLVRIKLFPRFDGAEYVTVVGKMKQFHADQYRLMKGGNEAVNA